MPNSAQNPPNLSTRVLISGKVQGVGYRYHTLHQARRLGINGWVKNLPSGRVEAIFEGKKAAVEQMLTWCHQGSPAAVVKEVAFEYQGITGIEDFTIL
ncbi:MAG: acylphosphatase [Okeania sp. SIO2D1]|nr:acylphosphatase [Okeania sp. SIO2D1]